MDICVGWLSMNTPMDPAARNFWGLAEDSSHWPSGESGRLATFQAQVYYWYPTCNLNCLRKYT